MTYAHTLIFIRIFLKLFTHISYDVLFFYIKYYILFKSLSILKTLKHIPLHIFYALELFLPTPFNASCNACISFCIHASGFFISDKIL